MGIPIIKSDGSDSLFLSFNLNKMLSFDGWVRPQMKL